MADDDVLPGRSAIARRHGPIHHIEQLPDRHRRRPRRVRALVVAGVGDEQLVGRRHQRVEQQLAVLCSRVALAHMRVVEQQVVAVAGRLAREDRVVHAEQADDPVRDRPHRHERADGQVAGAEVRSRRPPLEAVGQQRPDLRQLELGRMRHPVGRRLIDDVVQQPAQLRLLPLLDRAGFRQRVGDLVQGRRPGVDGLRRREPVDRLTQPIDQFRELPRQLDRARVDVIQRQDGAPDQPLPVLAHRHAREDSVHPRPPRAGGQHVEAERLAMRGIQSPANSGIADPVLEPGQIIVIEPEPPPHHVAVGQIQHLRCRQPAVRDVQQLPDQAEDRVRLPQAAVRQPDMQIALLGVASRRTSHG